MSSSRNEWIIKASDSSKRTINPIRNIVDNIRVAPNPNKTLISLALGDPTIGGAFKIDSAATEAVKAHLDKGDGNGYPPSFGDEQARTAIAKKYSLPTAPLSSNDIIIASGCSDALNLAIGALCNEGHNILLPAPGFPLYVTISMNKKIEAKFYNLLPEKNWEIDLKQLESLIDDKTSCMLLNNPSNPTGASYSKSHLLELLKLAEKYHLPIISDEIYADMVFKGKEFHPLASLTNTVPVLTAGGLAKRYLVPGWRIGWLLINDRNNAFDEIRPALVSLSQLIIGGNSLIQKAIPEIFENVPNDFFVKTMEKLEKNAGIVSGILKQSKVLKPIAPQGTMYIMVKVIFKHLDPKISSISQFFQMLLAEESVMCLPGTCFHCPEFFRVVFTLNEELLTEACNRVVEFCNRYQL